MKCIRAVVTFLIASIALISLPGNSSQAAESVTPGVGRMVDGSWVGPPCPDVMVIGARGSGEQPQGTGATDPSAYASNPTNGMGDINFDVYRQLATASPNLHFGYEGVQYGAFPVSGSWSDPSLWRTPQAYMANAQAGATWLVQEIGLIDARCKQRTKFVLTGYSQGAWLIHKALRQLSAARLNLVVGVALFGDPLFKAGQTINRINKTTATRNGVAYSIDNANVAIPTAVQRVTGDYCHVQDLVCQAGRTSDTEHTNYKTAGRTKAAADFIRPFLPAPTAWTTITSSAPTNGAVDAPYGKTFTSINGFGTVQWSTTSILPIGLTLSKSGQLAGTPTEAGTIELKIKATDSIGRSATTSYPLSIIGPDPMPIAENVLSWGYNNAGQLGDVPGGNALYPTTVPAAGADQVSAGDFHSLSLLDGHVFAWGDNTFGQLGDGSTVGQTQPVTALDLTNVTAISGGGNHSLALKSDGSVWSWGRNDYGQLGDGSTTNKSTPSQVIGLPPIIKISAGDTHSMALGHDGSVWTWGNNLHGEQGDNTTVNRPLAHHVSGLSGATDISANGAHSLALAQDGTVWAWGWNQYGQLGDFTNPQETQPVQVPGVSNIIQVSAGAAHSLALDGSGQVWAWGWNQYGQLDGGNKYRPQPYAEPWLSGITAISAGNYHNIALQFNGSFVTWGLNDAGQLGIGTTERKYSPVVVRMFAPVTSFSAGGSHNLVATA